MGFFMLQKIMFLGILIIIIVSVFFNWHVLVANTLVAAFERAFLKLTGKNFSAYFFPLKTLDLKSKEFLFDQLYFYKHLTQNQRAAFNHRVVRFSETRIFEGREGVVITPEIRLLISATAVQLTFGMRSYMMTEFKKILVYPRKYFNQFANQYHKGEVNVGGVVVLSWEDFYEGIRVPNDNLNLGLHEFAHVLALQRLHNPRYRDKFFANSFDKLMQTLSFVGARHILQQKMQFRAYASTEPMEFFAVATEVYFENPAQFYTANRVMYKLFAEMYNQNLFMHFRQPVLPVAP